MICVYGNLSCLRFGDLVLKRLVKCYSVLDVNGRSQDDEPSILVYEIAVIPCGYRYSNSTHDDRHGNDVVIQHCVTVQHCKKSSQKLIASPDWKCLKDAYNSKLGSSAINKFMTVLDSNLTFEYWIDVPHKPWTFKNVDRILP